MQPRGFWRMLQTDGVIIGRIRDDGIVRVARVARRSGRGEACTQNCYPLQNLKCFGYTGSRS